MKASGVRHDPGACEALGRCHAPHTLKSVHAAAFKVYTTISTRRFDCNLQDAFERGYLSRQFHPIRVAGFLENAALTPILKGLIVRSSLPLAAVETVFAPDSTGFNTSRFVRWYDEKYGATRSGREWVKAHAICGVNTKIVTAVEILDKNAADAPQFKALVETTAQGFSVEEVPSDKAYLSRDNLDLVARLGGTAYIPFKVNNVPGHAGTVWERMFHY